MKTQDLEPTYPLIVARCPNAVRNPETGEPVDKKVVYGVFRSMCRDEEGAETWDHVARQQKSALAPEVMQKRKDWAAYMMNDIGHTAAWYFRHVIRIDLCYSLLPQTEAMARKQALARKGKKGWISPDCKQYSRNLKGKAEDLQQNPWGVSKVWWIPILTHGKLHAELLPERFAGERPEAVGDAVSKIPHVLNVRFPNAAKPRIVMSDRGPAFYHAATGHITPEYKAALGKHGLRAMMGDDASAQCGDLQEAMLHATAMAWFRYR